MENEMTASVLEMNERDFLLMLVDKELEEEWGTCDDKNWIKALIRAKKWLLERKKAIGIDKWLRAMEISSDIDTYLHNK